MMGPLDEILGALLAGDWAQLLWELKELLDVVLIVLAVVALFIPLLRPAGHRRSSSSPPSPSTINAGLYATQWPNPETGETVGLGDVLWSAVGVVFSAGGALKAVNALRAVQVGNATRLANGNIVSAGNVIFRQETSLANLVRQGRGLVPQRFPLGTRTGNLTTFQVAKFANDGYRRLVRNPTTMAGFGAEDYVGCRRHEQPRPVDAGDPERRPPRPLRLPVELTAVGAATAARQGGLNGRRIRLRLDRRQPPREWVNMPVELRAFETMCGELRRRWREAPDWDRTDERQAELLLGRVRSELVHHNVRFAAMYADHGAGRRGRRGAARR